MQIRIPLDDHELAVNVPPAQIFTSGTNAGYIELELHSDESLPIKRLYDGLRLEIPGELQPLAPTAHDLKDTGAVLTFFSAQVSNAGRLPHAINLVWDENGPRPLSELAFVEAGAERLPEVNGEAELAGDQTRSDVE